MQPVHEYDYSTLKWVKGEIDESLKAAREALEGYFEDDDPRMMRICLDRLHEVQGTLRVLDIEGAAMLSSEMEETGKSLLVMADEPGGTSEDRREAIIEALMGAMLRLPGYLERVQEGHRDVPAALLPVFNDLRQHVGRAPLAEADLFRPSLHVSPPRTNEASSDDPRALAKHLRPVFQSGLVAWLRKVDLSTALKKFEQVFHDLGKACALPEAARLWWVASGFVEALHDDGIDDAVQVNPLFPKLDRQLKLLQDRGEAALDNPEATTLTLKMLYLVGRSTSHGIHVEDLRSAFALDQLLPTEEEIQEFEGSLSGATVTLMDTVAEALRDDLHAVMEPLDVFTRSRDRNVVELRSLAQRLDDIADTLAMLGVSSERDRLHTQSKALVEMVTGERNVTNDSLSSVAHALLMVEQALGGIDSTKTSEAGSPESTDVNPTALTGSVMHEARANLEAIKDQVIEFIASGGSLSVHNALRNLDEVRGSLVILGQQRAADIVLHCENYLNGALQHGDGVPEKQQIESFAEAISGLEYYLEAVDEGLGGQKQILESIERALASLPEYATVATPVTNYDAKADDHGKADAARDATSKLTPLAPIELEIAGAAEEISSNLTTDTEEAGAPMGLEISPNGDTDSSQAGKGLSLELTTDQETSDLGVPTNVGNDVALDRFDSTADESLGFAGGSDAGTGHPSPPQASSADITAPAAAAPSGSTQATQARPFEMPKVAVEHDADAELVEIFIEEASEEIDSINRAFPEWQSAPDNHESLANLRRSFHTLKGSGRMVGAWLMGEYAWAFENMFNGVLDENSSPSPDMFRLVKTATDVLPQLVDQLQTGVEPSANIEAFMDGAWALQAGEPLPGTIADILDAASLKAGPKSGSAAGLGKEPAPASLTIHEPESEPSETLAETPLMATMAPERDPVLMEIFKEEAEGHIDTIRNYVGHARTMAPTERLVSDDLLRALHTIHGSGRMAEVNEIADLAGHLEHYVKDIAASRHYLSEEAIDLLEDSASALDEAMDSLDFDADILPHRQELLDRIAGIGREQPQQAAHEKQKDSAKTHLQEVFLSDAADILQGADETFKAWRSQPEKASHLADLLGDLATLADGSKLAGNDALGELSGTEHRLLEQVAQGEIAFNDEFADLLAQTHDRLWALLESSREGIAAPEDEQLTNRLKAAATVAAQVPTAEPATAEAEEQATPPPNEQQPKAEVSRAAIPLQSIPLSYEDTFPTDVDLELLEAFLEEGEDLLGVADSLITRLSKDPSDSKSMDELRRSMHTVKGGARMVGLMTMGNLSHALESMVQAIADGQLPPSERLFELLQMSHDTMANMLERARDAKPLPRVDTLIQQVEGILSGEADLALAEKPIETRREEVPPVEPRIPEPAKPAEPAPKAAADRREGPRPQQEQVRVRADLLNQLVNFAGEVSISRSRIEEQITGFRFNLQELDQTIIRLRQQLRKLEVETEAQILFRHEQDTEADRGDFDPLEMDRYSTVQQLSRQLLESVSDFVSLHGILLDETREAETLLLQQSRVNTELQEGLIRTRMVPFSGLAPRLRRIVRQTSKELGKKIELRLEGSATEVDRTVLDRMVSPLEHLLRNSINHGIETPKDRKKAGKSTTGLIRIALTREGQEVVISIYDDGRGLDLTKIRRKAVANGLMKEGAPLSDKEVMHFILEPGFTTATAVTQIAGRGVGMDVVSNEIKQLSGNLEINSLEGRSTTFTIRLPLTLSVSQALLVTVHDHNYAIPLSSIESVIQLSKMEADKLYTAAAPRIERGDRSYQFVPLPLLLDQPVTPLQNEGDRLPVLLFTAGETSVAMSVDALLGVQEIVVKSVGAQLGRIREISGATILGDGRVVLIMDMGSLLRKVIALHGTVAAADHLEMEERVSHDKTRVMVVDDSITVRKITQRLLERNNMSVVTAKDGVDATTLLLEDEEVPDIIVTDIEMPRMDGYELATLIRNDTRLSDIPIIMITSRTGTKHRDRAEAVGVNRYLGKPFQESDLLATIASLVHTDTP
jgi:chemosensory pili system protein ChpA (sensor histidine kinase/response regulator)